MKRIETLTPKERLAVVRTLNNAAVNGKSEYICPGRCVKCEECTNEPECEPEYINEPGCIRTVNDWLNWLLDEVETPGISSGYRVIYTEHSNIFFIARPDGTNLYAKGRPLVLLPVDLKRYSEFVIFDVFSSRYGAACILVEDPKTGEMRFYSDILL